MIRRATIEDLKAITAIYNDAILKTTATFDTEPKTPKDQTQWFAQHTEKYPLFVYATAHQVVGWASLSQWSDRCAYSDTAEISLYVAEAHRGQGIGTQLISALMEEGQTVRLHTVIARIAEGNHVSVRLHENAGFQVIGTMKEVGNKFDRRIDVLLMQRMF